jgi:hypothetical protein
MLMIYFAGQTPPPHVSQPTTAGPVRPFQQTGQTGSQVISPATPAPIASLPCTADPSQTDELANFVPSYATVAYRVPPIPPQASGVPRGQIPDDVYNDLLKHVPVSLVQTMAQTYPISLRLVSNTQTSTCSKYEANFAKLKEDLANMIKTKLGVDMGKSRLYQKPYSDDFDLVSYPTGWRVPNFIKFSGDDNRTTWNTLVNMLLNLVKLVLVTLCVFAYFLCL